MDIITGELPAANKLLSVKKKALKIERGLYLTRNHSLHAINRIVNPNINKECLADQGLDNDRKLLHVAVQRRANDRNAGLY